MKILLFGTGDYYERYKKWFDHDEVLALLDNSLEKQNKVIDGTKILSPKEGVKLSFDVIVILSFYVKSMKSQLISLGVAEERIFHFYDLHGLIYCKEIEKPVQFYGNSEEIVKSYINIGNKILLLSHDLTFGGPAIALFHAAKILKKRGYQVIYASMLDGPLRKILEKENISVVVDVNLQIMTMQNAGWISRFDLLICNTINYYVFLSERNISVPVIWWLHDSLFFYDGVNKEVLKRIDRTNMQTYSVGAVPGNALQKFVPDMPVKRLLYGVEDTMGSGQKRDIKKEKIRFVTIGYIEERKGQDVLIDAIKKLPETMRQKAEFYFVGQNSSLLAQRLKSEMAKLPEVTMTGTVGREEIDHILRDADVMVCPSREDPMPTVTVEAMMHCVPCIVSNASGITEFIENGEDGFIFQNEDAQGLFERIAWCIVYAHKLHAIGCKARQLYLKYFSMNVFENELIRAVGSLI